MHWIADYPTNVWGNSAGWVQDESVNPHEAHYPKVCSSKARARLGWLPRWSLSEDLDKIVSWHHACMAGADLAAVYLDQTNQSICLTPSYGASLTSSTSP